MVHLREGGEKLSRDEIRRQPGLSGDLRIEPHNGGQLARLHPGHSHGQGAATLYSARLTHLRDGSCIVVGAEEYDKSWKNLERPQAWWCRLDVDAALQGYLNEEHRAIAALLGEGGSVLDGIRQALEMARGVAAAKRA